ncbi:Ig-like domain-containing protein [Catenovulum adriaticum]|uniref:Ig-like domain-containing protein n=1 Tax=Catenovulum adriaticum TaxID=2984846 RepID=A0ABY7ARD9_9ALTE|nr:Ig-like domain-containing protein [Catenovulum sp. TS8]WAJ72110.1 Ig-like domain-containing protein [Catenovulum sp. TS8]
MKSILTKKSVIALAIMAGLTACGSDNDDKSSNNIPPVTVAPGEFEIVVAEDQPAAKYSLLSNVKNEGNRIFARDFEHIFAKDEDGVKLPTEPDIPFQGITKQAENIIINPASWADVLEYGESLRYQFDYVIDNGSDTLVERSVYVRVFGAENKVSQIDILVNDDIEIPVGEMAQFNAEVEPDNATFKEVTWSSSDETIATVDISSGMVEGVAEGMVEISATSKDREVVATKQVKIVTNSTKPIGVEITQDGEIVNEVSVEEGGTLQLGANVMFQNETETSNKNVTWSSANEGVFTIDSSGMLTGVSRFKGASVARVRTQEQGLNDDVTVNVVANSNYLYGLNHSFELGKMGLWGRYWETPADTTLEVTTEAASEGDYGVHIKTGDTIDKHVGLVLTAADFPQILGANNDKTYRVTFDIKSNKAGGEGYFRGIVAGAWADRWEGWFAFTTEWTTVTIEKPAKDWVKHDPAKARLDFYLVKDEVNGIDVYIDNIQLREVK